MYGCDLNRVRRWWTVRAVERTEEASWVDVERTTPRRRTESQRGYPGV